MAQVALRRPPEALLEVLLGVLPELNAAECADLAMALAHSVDRANAARIQHTDAMTGAVLDGFGPGLGGRATAVRQAVAARWWDDLQPLHGAVEMLGRARGLELVTVLVSNTAWYSQRDFRERLDAMGLGGMLDHVDPGRGQYPTVYQLTVTTKS